MSALYKVKVFNIISQIGWLTPMTRRIGGNTLWVKAGNSNPAPATWHLTLPCHHPAQAACAGLRLSSRLHPCPQIQVAACSAPCRKCDCFALFTHRQRQANLCCHVFHLCLQPAASSAPCRNVTVCYLPTHRQHESMSCRLLEAVLSEAQLDLDSQQVTTTVLLYQTPWE